MATKAAYVSDPKNPAPPVPEDHAPIIDLQVIAKRYSFKFRVIRDVSLHKNCFVLVFVKNCK